MAAQPNTKLSRWKTISLGAFLYNISDSLNLLELLGFDLNDIIKVLPWWRKSGREGNHVCVTSSNEMCRARRCRVCVCVGLWLVLLLLGERVDFRDKSLRASFESALKADGRADDDELEAPILIKI